MMYLTTVMRKLLTGLLPLLFATPLAGHPHIFVDTGLELRFDANGMLTEVEVTWVYDEFYSLLITEDRGLDPDFDGVLTTAEQQDLVGFDMQWSEGFNGDLVITQGDHLLELSRPLRPTATFAGGRITTTHVRKVALTQTPGVQIDVKPYDPTYYSAYDITQPVTIAGRDGCAFLIDVPDIDARLQELQEILSSLDAETTPEDEGLPDIGGLLATTVSVTCATS